MNAIAVILRSKIIEVCISALLVLIRDSVTWYDQYNMSLKPFIQMVHQIKALQAGPLKNGYKKNISILLLME